MKKKLKDFFTLTRKAEGGFTLVELIVVIAILGILGGVAVPAYSGYVKKAERAADEQLLAAVNTAFASACVTNGTDIYLVNSADVDWQDNAVKGITNPSEMNDAFLMFYDDSTESEFKVFPSISFDPVAHCFVADIVLTYNGVSIVVSKAAAVQLMASTYGKLGTDALLDQIDFVTDIAAGMADGTLNKVFNDPAFIQAAMGALGITDSSEFNKKYVEMYKQMAEEQGITEAEAIAKLNANAAVLYAADNALTYTDEQIAALFANGETTASTIVGNLTGSDGNSATGMADTALVYGMYLAYANSDQYGNETLQANANDAGAVLSALKSDPNFLTYANSPEGKADMEAYLSSLGMIVDSADTDPAVVEHLMLNGFNNNELKGVVSDAVN